MEDWAKEAKALANHCYHKMFTAHRGAMPWRRAGFSVIFGNDGYMGSRRAKAEVEALRVALAVAGIDELGFGVDDEEGYAWAMVVRSPNVDELGQVIHLLWAMVCSSNSPEAPAFNACQMGVADVASMLLKTPIRPRIADGESGTHDRKSKRGWTGGRNSEV